MIPVPRKSQLPTIAFVWFCLHWLVLLIALLPYPEPRLTVMKIAIVLDGWCCVYFLYIVWSLIWLPALIKRQQLKRFRDDY